MVPSAFFNEFAVQLSKPAAEVVEVVDAVLQTYVRERAAGERFIATLRRLGVEPFKTAANAVRHITAREHA